MSKINSTQINQIKEAINIVDVIEKFVTLAKKGNGYLGLCPFHGDARPSMRVCPTRQTYKCFVCGAGGDVFGFLQSHENMSFPDAVRFCANIVGIEVHEEGVTNEELQLRQQKEGCYIAIEAATSYYQEKLPTISTYLKTRGYNHTDQVIKDFRIGYAPDGNTTINELSKRGYNPETLERVNVVGKSKYGSYYDVFQDRLVFPFLDNMGRPIGYSGRIIQPKEGVGKYVNTSDTPLFRKGNNIFGLFQARTAIGRLNHAFLVEGQFDVMSLHSVGVTNAIAGSGTALTEEQIRLLARYTRKVTIAYDSDKAGIAATLKNCRNMLLHGFNVSCVLLKEGTDPDNLALEEKEQTMVWLKNKTIDIVTYYCALYQPEKIEDPIEREERLKEICELVSCTVEESLRDSYIKIISKRFNSEYSILRKKIKEIRSELPLLPAPEEMKDGVYGLEVIDKETVFITADFDLFMEDYGSSPTIFVKGKLSMQDIQSIRRSVSLIEADGMELFVNKNGIESTVMMALADCYKNGITGISIEMVITGKPEDSDDYEDEVKVEGNWIFPNAYVYKYESYLKQYKPYDSTPYIQNCAEIIASSEDSVRIVNMSFYKSWLGLTKAELNEVMKPFISKRKSRMAINSQRNDDEYDYDPDTIPDYVENEPRYNTMYQQCKFYPKLNKDGVPVCYIFKNGNDKGHTMVGDFFMEPLLHITSDIDEDNKKVVKINRRYYKKPIFLEINSKYFLKKSTIEERLIMLEAVNFSDGEEKHWTKIKEWMSRNFVTCSGIKVYGNQQIDGHSRDERNMFFSFANGIYHQVDGRWQFDPVNELGVVTHNNENYYLPAFSTIYAGADNSDKYELISTLLYKEIPPQDQCSFEKWSKLMDEVYKMNDNGKWAILFGIMSAFRSNIHIIDRLFTAPFFMGPMSSGKTQIAISIRSLFISPKVPIFNLTNGTDAAMSTLMGTFRDVPVVLDEYNNNDISDTKFQALKGIVYDGDGKQKRKGTSGREIENDKVYAPVIICGQETPQKDDNALMSRIIVCEVPKPVVERTQEEIDKFNELKDIEANGLSNVLLDILKLRPIVMDKFRTLKLEAYKELKSKMNSTGELDRLMKTASLFLATCKIIQDYSNLELPFTYDQFFEVALNKIRFQVDMISKSDKLATFFKAIDVMIDNKTIIEGRDFHIEVAEKLTIKTSSDMRQEIMLPPGTRVLYLRFSNIYVHFKRIDKEGSSDTTLLQNLRSNTSYIGAVNSHRFAWLETVETAKGAYDANDPDKACGDLTMVKKREARYTNTSCLALNYDLFKASYGIDLQRNSEQDEPSVEKQQLPF